MLARCLHDNFHSLNNKSCRAPAANAKDQKSIFQVSLDGRGTMSSGSVTRRYSIDSNYYVRAAHVSVFEQFY